MKALSLRQPSVEAILSGLKTIEVRRTSTKHRGDLLLHASGRYGVAEKERTALLRERGVDLADVSRDSLGALCGVVQLVDCHRVTPADWAQALVPPSDDGIHWAWVLAEPERFPAPIPFKGHLFLFEVSDEELARAAAAAPEPALALTQA